MAVEDLCHPSSGSGTVPNFESGEPIVELGSSRKRKRSKKKRCELGSNDKSCESPSLQSQPVKHSDKGSSEPLREKTTSLTDSASPQLNLELSPLIEKKKKKKKKGCKTAETSDTGCDSPSLLPQHVQLSDQQPQSLTEKLATITDAESPQSHIEPSLSQNKKRRKKKKRKGCETPETNDQGCESLSILPQLVQVADLELEVSQDLRLTVKNKKSNGEQSNMPAIDPGTQRSVEISSKWPVVEPLVEGMSTTTNSKCPIPNADFGSLKEMKKKKRKRSLKTDESKELAVETMMSEVKNESKELVVETMMSETDPSFEPSLAIISEEDMPRPNADSNRSQEPNKKKRKKGRKTSDIEVLVEPEVAEPLVEGMGTVMNSGSGRHNADFSCSQETKKKKRKKGRKPCDSKELLIMTPEADTSLQPLVAVFPKPELEVPRTLNTDAEPVVEGLSMNSGNVESNADCCCLQERKKKKRKTSDSKELIVEVMTPEADPSLHPLLAVFPEHELEVPQSLNTDAEPVVEGLSINSGSVESNADCSCPQEGKKKKRKKKQKTSDSKELIVEVMTPEADTSLQPLLAVFPEHELEVLRSLDTDAEPVVEGLSMNSGGVESNADCSCPQERKKKRKKKQKTSEVVISREANLLEMSNSSPGRSLLDHSQKKLLILDINGLLADIRMGFIPRGFQPDTRISKKQVYKRPFCDDFLQFCFDRFNVGVWSSRTKHNVELAVDFLLGESKHKLLFCWNQSHCTSTRCYTVENKEKPLVLKELRKLWEKCEPDLPWEKGEYNESNTVLLDDSPYKALGNPANTAIFPKSYKFDNIEDRSLGPGGDIRSYLEGLATAENVQQYVEQNPFGQKPITKSNPYWALYKRVIEGIKP